MRGGLSTIATLRANAEDTYITEGMWGVSGWVAIDGKVDSLLADLGDLIPHPTFRTAPVGALEDHGFRVAESPPAHHVTIYIGQEVPTDEVLGRLETVFSPPKPR